MVALFLIIAFSTSAWERYGPIVSVTLFFLGIIMVGIASLGRLWCSLYIAGYKTDRLITQGPYSICRNPLYFFSLIGALGVGFASECFLIPFVIFISFCAYYPLVIKKEEAELLKLHKNEFESYLRRVPKFFPKISNLLEPEEYIVRPIIFRRHIFSALWFIWLVGILEVIEELHELRILPVIFNIY
ncbi:MAG: hypothetical protein AMJ94_09550 [Deltaproteobacteria bacterium SM23_61]|nr:MAG: hypothetical protein AMJ94_09550 [Deltaproteobacteria bacterium SM23_61]